MVPLVFGVLCCSAAIAVTTKRAAVICARQIEPTTGALANELPADFHLPDVHHKNCEAVRSLGMNTVKIEPERLFTANAPPLAGGYERAQAVPEN